MCRVLHLLREPGEEEVEVQKSRCSGPVTTSRRCSRIGCRSAAEVEVLRPSDDVAQVLEDRLQIGCTSAIGFRSASDRLQIGCTSAATSSLPARPQ